MSNRSHPRLGAVLVGALLALAACSGRDQASLTTPTNPTTPATTIGGASSNEVTVQHRGFMAGGGSGIVASEREPGVFWAVRDRGGMARPGRPQNALYAFEVADGRVGSAPGSLDQPVELPVPAHDWEAVGRDDDGNLWVGDIGNNECNRSDTALLKVREPDPAAEGLATVLATYRYRFPDPPAGCAGRNAEAMFLLGNVPYIIDKAAPSTLYRFPELDPAGTVTLERVGTLAGGVAKLSGADLSTDGTLLAVDTHTTLYIYQSSDPKLGGKALAADLIARPPRWTVPLERPGASTPVNVEGVAFAYGGHDLVLLAENRDVFFVPAGAYMG
ncbi:MAG TPA: hypothetical protein VFU54_15850 [Actinomycetota bacterium]|nr:hypothetical protein [Actinomycetota bacterium]